jgi:hypothetical protein
MNCDHAPLCPATIDGEVGESRATPLVRLARSAGWVCSDGRQYCPAHGDEADPVLLRERS